MLSLAEWLETRYLTSLPLRRVSQSVSLLRRKTRKFIHLGFMPFDSRVQYHEFMHMLSQAITEGSMKTTGLQVIIKLLDDALSSVNGLWAQIYSNAGPKSQVTEELLKFKWKRTLHQHQFRVSNIHDNTLQQPASIPISPNRAPERQNHLVLTLT